ncbi:MAG: TspO/MBR family protein [Steroidobacteraceae bacterium]
MRTPPGLEPSTRTPRGRGLLLVSFLIVFVAEALGALASVHAAAFYAQLTQPAWAPPAWLFGPVWTVLYVLMAIALWRVWRMRATGSVPIVLFLLQLAVNAAWSWLFFRWHLGPASFAWIVLLLVLLVATVLAFWRADHLAATLLLPYLVWVSFACALSWAIWRANPTMLG